MIKQRNKKNNNYKTEKLGQKIKDKNYKKKTETKTGRQKL